MGTMEKMRKTSPYFLAAFAILFVGFMVLSDADISNLVRSGTNYQTAAVAEVEGESILYKDYEAKVKELFDQQQKEQKDPNQPVDDNAVRNQVWTQMVDDILLRHQAKKFGINITDDDIRDVLLENP
ncbi:MAG: SurA N-terminal domain-containing protein, partial [Bacteroidota bacterium]